MIAIVDYGVGNLFSLKSSFAAIGYPAEVTGDLERIRSADKVILPGVGAFEDAAKKLHDTGLDSAVKDAAKAGKPLLGICLGMQMLFDKSLEYGEHRGLGLINGTVEPIEGIIPRELKIPHIGWNALHLYGESPIFKYTKEGDCVYFVHSYYGVTYAENVIADTEYGAPLTAAVQSGSVFGCQFHPEKSGAVGLDILRAFCEI